MKYRAPFLLLLLTAALGAQAQVYRSVGPDGKVVFTDSPPAGSSSGLSAVNVKDPNGQVSNQAPAGGQPGADAPAPKKPKHVANKAAAAPTPVVPVVPDAALINAVSGVAGLEDLINQTRNICIRTLPNAFEKYTSAADAWAQRNATVIAQKNHVLAQAFSEADGAALVEKAKAHNQQTLSAVLGGTSAKRVSWCDKSADDMGKGTLDAFNNPNIAGPLGAFK
jgi:hypothetical protein